MQDHYGTDAMMEFRTVYLRAIAKTWREPEFLKELTKNPVNCLRKEFRYVLPWDIDLEIEHVSSDESLWDPVNTGGWVGRNAVITIWIPPAPASKDDWAEAWAAYYDEYPSFLGSKVGKSFDTIKTQDTATHEHSHLVGGPYPLGMGKWSDFLEFSAVIMRLIALVWRDAQARKELKSVQKTNKGVTILNKWLGYNMTWNMDVEFSLAGWDEYEWNSTDKKWPARPFRNGLRFYIPNKPVNPGKDSSSIEAIALSAYNVTGDQYPFTCP